MFHAATSALLKHGIERASHKGTIAALSQFLVKPGHLDKRFHAMLRKGFEARGESDYWPSPGGTLEDAENMLGDAREFVVACCSFVQGDSSIGP